LAPAFELLNRLVDRTMAPLEPVFVATRREWLRGPTPQLTFRAAVLMLLGGYSTESAVSVAVGDDACVQRFLRVPLRGAPGLDSSELVNGITRLVRNINVRAALAALVQEARTDGLIGRDGIFVNPTLLVEWTTAA
jgi:hypothetical protein